MTVVFQDDYAERVYAGVLGKVIGVYLGRPFEGWSYERIQSELGDIEGYVHNKLGVPLIVTDDDISGTFTFVRALADNGYDVNITAEQIGQAWLNYLVEERTILWWGGMGNSTEHTAYLRLKDGIPAPLSGAAELNGKIVSEQIGAQIFIDGWAMVSPGDPDQAALLAKQAATVSHDGEAVYGAIVLAVMEAMAFVESDIDRLLDGALSYIPADSLIRRLIDDVRGWHAKEKDWRATRAQLASVYGYDKYGGNCHMVPNHGLIIHALLHGEDDFAQTMKIINTCGWDTDCNSGNVGCLMGIKNGVKGIDESSILPVDWRGPVADRIYVPTADPTWGISDCASEALFLVNTARRMAGEEALTPKGNAQFHFSWPGSVQGFTVTHGTGQVSHQNRALLASGAAGVRVGTPVFSPSKDVSKYFEKRNYALMASPRVYPGQTIYADLEGPDPANLYVAFYGNGDRIEILRSAASQNSAQYRIEYKIPPEAHPVFEIGVELPDGGRVEVDAMGWHGTPDVEFSKRASGSMWRRAWVDGVDNLWSFVEPYRLIQNTGTGLLIQGTRDWHDYEVSADVTPHLAKAVGIAARVQGMRRYYALKLTRVGLNGVVQLVRMLHTETVLAEVSFPWRLNQRVELAIRAIGSSITGTVGEVTLTADDDRLTSGGIALLVEEGRSATDTVCVRPAGQG